MREQVNMALLDDDDAFEAALTFLDEYEFEEAKAEDFGTPGGHHEAAQTKGKSFGSFANPVPKTCTMPSKAPTESWSSDGKLKRKKALNEEREILRKTGVYGDPNRSRNERKKEIAFLREQLQKLQLDLRALQSRAAERSYEKTADTEESGCVMALIPKVWQEMAVHQRRRRQEAEHENIHLKLVVEQQQKVADNLCSLLRKRSTHLNYGFLLLPLAKEYSAFTDAANSGHYVDRALDFRGNIGDFHALSRHLDAATLELDTMLINNGLATMTISPIDVHIREDIGGKYMEFFTYKELPFSVRESLMGPLERNGETHHGQWRVVPEDSKAVHDHGELHQGAVLEHCSGRRPRQASCPTLRRIDRDIIIWVARLTPTEIKHKLLRGLTYNLRDQAFITLHSRTGIFHAATGYH